MTCVCGVQPHLPVEHGESKTREEEEKTKKGVKEDRSSIWVDRTVQDVVDPGRVSQVDGASWST